MQIELKILLTLVMLIPVTWTLFSISPVYSNSERITGVIFTVNILLALFTFIMLVWRS